MPMVGSADTSRCKVLWHVAAGIVASLGLVIPAFYKVEPLAGLLMLPYLAWAIFALFLNSTLINMNPQVSVLLATHTGCPSSMGSPIKRS